jgi:hypothetical protein
VLQRVSLEHDVFTHDDHRLLDAKILNGFSLYWELNKEPDYPTLLFHITAADNRLISFSTDEVDELLHQEPSITKILRNAWQAGSFKEVRQLGAFAVQYMCYYQLNIA